MRLTCPSCGAIGSLEAWYNDTSCRQTLDILSKLPSAVASRTPAYLALFRHGQSGGLSWPRALKVIVSLRDLVATGKVRHGRNEERPCPPEHWARSMDMTIEAKPAALTNHHYLVKVAWTNAAPAAAQAEQKAESQARYRSGDDDPFKSSSSSPRKKSCWTCAHKQAKIGSKTCSADHLPAAGNENVGCSHWQEKVLSAGEITGEIVSGLQPK